jgi:hypothetical protein
MDGKDQWDVLNDIVSRSYDECVVMLQEHHSLDLSKVRVNAALQIGYTPEYQFLPSQIARNLLSSATFSVHNLRIINKL